jgi:hypothetical protein
LTIVLLSSIMVKLRLTSWSRILNMLCLKFKIRTQSSLQQECLPVIHEEWDHLSSAVGKWQNAFQLDNFHKSLP